MSEGTNTSTTTKSTASNQQQQITLTTKCEELGVICGKLGGNNSDVRIIIDQNINGGFIIDHSEKDIVSLGITAGTAYNLKKISQTTAPQQLGGVFELNNDNILK